MLGYETDEEKVEALKNWWKANGFAVIAGVVIGLGAIFGWRAWTGYQDRLGQRASAAFEQLLATAQRGDQESALAQAELFQEKFASTTYATLASLLEAKVHLARDDPGAARAALEQAMDSAPDPAIEQIAALRLARVLVAEGELDAASDLIAAHDEDGSFSGSFAAVRGDIALARGNPADARAAYEEALAAGAPNPEQLQMKLDELRARG